jgi:hypothetical protein
MGVSAADVQFPFKHEKDRERLTNGLRLIGMKDYY